MGAGAPSAPWARIHIHTVIATHVAHRCLHLLQSHAWIRLCLSNARERLCGCVGGHRWHLALPELCHRVLAEEGLVVDSAVFLTSQAEDHTKDMECSEMGWEAKGIGGALRGLGCQLWLDGFPVDLQSQRRCHHLPSPISSRSRKTGRLGDMHACMRIIQVSAWLDLRHVCLHARIPRPHLTKVVDRDLPRSARVLLLECPDQPMLPAGHDTGQVCRGRGASPPLMLPARHRSSYAHMHKQLSVIRQRRGHVPPTDQLRYLDAIADPHLRSTPMSRSYNDEQQAFFLRVLGAQSYRHTVI